MKSHEGQNKVLENIHVSLLQDTDANPLIECPLHSLCCVKLAFPFIFKNKYYISKWLRLKNEARLDEKLKMNTLLHTFIRFRNQMWYNCSSPQCCYFYF